MGKYDPLARYLTDMPRDRWDASFEEIERILNFELPPSAREHRAWWGNSRQGNHSQAKGWIGAGWAVSDVDLKREAVRLERVSWGGRKPATSDINELWRKAREISGISDRAELEKAAVISFIQREAAKRLVAMGGSDPDAWAAPRERPIG